MLETRAIVVRLEGKEALVEGARQGGCGACSSSNACGSGKLNLLLGVQNRQFRVCNESGAQVGDEVEIVVPEGVLLRNALILYGLPLLVMFVGAILSNSFFLGALGADAATAVGAVAGLSVGFLLAYFYAALRGNHVLARQPGRNERP